MRPATSSAIPESFPNPDTLVPRSFTTTRALRSARSSTYARPSPRPAPVTTATFPSNEIRSVISLSSCGEHRNRPSGPNLTLPDHAIVLSVDEKSQIQALDRTQPGLPMKKGRAGTMTHDYKRHG